ncbi:guanylate-binding protein 4-like isoform X9 [Ursus arctos]|uniref:guanylate-binding protein 4-like isoform X9 n=1 Tax=Ursus arctos TaxID=9644 RepID=UPI002018380E|nr:guanylate-binding protein 4-like isoform X9 [Ursus arctos]XP_057166484.1 guanylate-binding protein 4-like isoform X9 [Ursus arctos]
MASGSTMTAPICLVENHGEQLNVNPEALQILDKISQPVVVVGIVGLYRTGKSYLMNRLAGQNHGFVLGSTVRSETKGIWMWCVPHPSKLNHTLVLLDTEGLGTNPKIQNSNLPRECIKQFFPKRKCFIFDRPTSDRNLLFHLEKVPEDKLDSTFQEQSKKFCTYIFNHTKTKTLKEGIIVTGSRLRTLVVTYVDTINTGAVPCLENVVTTLAQRENSVAVQKAADHYSKQMVQRLTLPTDTLQELLDVHADCEREAIAVFMEHSFKDEKREFQKKLMDTVKERKKDFLLQNEDASFKYSQAQLKQLSEPLMKSISIGTFCVPGGYHLYLEAKEKVESDYNLVPRKGVKANEVLQQFLQNQVAVENSILQGDALLTYQEKALAAEWALKKAAEKEVELLSQKYKEQQQKLEAQERSFKENIAQLRDKLERERENFRMEQEKMLKHKLKIQEELLNEGFLKKSVKLHAEIQLLKKEIAANKEDKYVCGTAEQAKEEAAEKEVELLSQKYKEQQQKLEAQERSFKENIAQLRDKLERDRENLQREQEKMLKHKLKRHVLEEVAAAEVEQMTACVLL